MNTEQAKAVLVRLGSTAMRVLKRALLDFLGFATGVAGRKRLRQRLLVWPSPIMALLLLVSWKTWGMVHYGDKAVEDHTARQDLAMRADIDQLRGASLTDSWRIHFFEASQLLIASTNPPLDAADRELVAALADAPAEDSCGIRADLVGIREVWGDREMTSGHFSQAVQRLREALDFAEHAPDGCFQGSHEPNPGFHQWLEQTKERLNLKIQLIQDGKLLYENGKYAYPAGDGPIGLGYPGDDQINKACADLPDDTAKARCVKDNKNVPPKPAQNPQSEPEQPAQPDQPPPPPAPEPSPEQAPSQTLPEAPRPDNNAPRQTQADPDLTSSGDELALGGGSSLDKLKKLFQAYRANQNDKETPTQK